jgi:hypothetical protein
MIDQKSLLFLFFVVAMLLVAGSPCFSCTTVNQGGLVRGESKQKQVFKDNARISKMKPKKTIDHQYPCGVTNENNEGTEPLGEVSGSVAITSDGQVWLTVFLDDIALLARVIVFEKENSELSYRFVIDKIERPNGTHGSVSSDVLSLIDEEARKAEFSSLDEAMLELLHLINALGLELQAGTRKAVQLAIGCGWRTPKTAKNMIEEAIFASKVSKNE